MELIQEREVMYCTSSWAVIRTNGPCGGAGAGSGTAGNGGSSVIPIVPVDDLAIVGPDIQYFFDNELPDYLEEYINNPNQNYVRHPI